APAGEAAESPEDRPPGRRLGSLRRRLILLGLAALALGIAAGILIATSDDDSDDAGGEGGETSQATQRSAAGGASDAAPPRPKRELGPVAELEQQIEGVGGEVAARLIRSGGRVRLALRASDLPKPKAGYEVWLLDAPRGALSLARFKTQDFELDARLPAGFAGYQQLDITIEPEDGNKDHSGLSAFRTDVRNLAIR
ncbi:MAG: anti-sigma factor, partial [Thermoleophilaceae bacterium]